MDWQKTLTVDEFDIATEYMEGMDVGDYSKKEMDQSIYENLINGTPIKTTIENVVQYSKLEATARKKLHLEQSKREREAKRYRTCQRCSGQGKLFGYWHIQNGICFKCGGTGKVRN